MRSSSECSPSLDVLIVVVDDVKYADLRLFQLLRSLPQSHENLHGVLNKVDRLEARYPGRWKSVAGEILDRFCGKARSPRRLPCVEGALCLAISARGHSRAAAARAQGPSSRQANSPDWLKASAATGRKNAGGCKGLETSMRGRKAWPRGCAGRR